MSYEGPVEKKAREAAETLWQLCLVALGEAVNDGEVLEVWSPEWDVDGKAYRAEFSTVAMRRARKQASGVRLELGRVGRAWRVVFRLGFSSHRLRFIPADQPLNVLAEARRICAAAAEEWTTETRQARERKAATARALEVLGWPALDWSGQRGSVAARYDETRDSVSATIHVVDIPRNDLQQALKTLGLSPGVEGGAS